MRKQSPQLLARRQSAAATGLLAKRSIAAAIADDSYTLLVATRDSWLGGKASSGRRLVRKDVLCSDTEMPPDGTRFCAITLGGRISFSAKQIFFLFFADYDAPRGRALMAA